MNTIECGPSDLFEKILSNLELQNQIEEFDPGSD